MVGEIHIQASWVPVKCLLFLADLVEKGRSLWLCRLGNVKDFNPALREPLIGFPAST